MQGLDIPNVIRKIGFLTRKLLKIFSPERVTIAFGKARVKTKILTQSRRSQQPIFELCSVYSERNADCLPQNGIMCRMNFLCNGAFYEPLGNKIY